MQINPNMPSEVPNASGDAGTKLAYSIREAVQATGLSRSYLYEAIAAGELVARKAGSRTVIARSDLEAYIAQLRTAR